MFVTNSHPFSSFILLYNVNVAVNVVLPEGKPANDASQRQ